MLNHKDKLLEQAIIDQNLKNVKFAINCGANVNFDLSWPVRWAIKTVNLKLLKVLLSHISFFYK